MVRADAGVRGRAWSYIERRQGSRARCRDGVPASTLHARAFTGHNGGVSEAPRETAPVAPLLRRARRLHDDLRPPDGPRADPALDDLARRARLAADRRPHRDPAQGP